MPTLIAVVAAGALLRLLLAGTAESALDADEATVALMALDVLDGRATPFFFYGAAYNGGGALEAWLTAAGFWLFGPRPIVVKLCILLLWTVAALLFAQLCARGLARSRAIAAVTAFSLATPFLLEWSLKARGGYVETLLLGIVLLGLAQPGSRLGPGLRAATLGRVAGIGLWVSEMLLAMLPCAALWLLLGEPRERRLRLGAVMAAGLVVGLVPLIAYNALHEGSHLRDSFALQALTGARPFAPLSLAELRASLAFVLGPVWPVVALLVAAGAVRHALEREAPPLALVLLAHLALFAVAYWASGLRYLPVPPARVLFSLYPGLCVLAAVAVFPLARHRLSRAVAVGAVGVWAGAVGLSVASWIASGEPREAGSWRGSWALVDGDALYRELAGRRIELAYTGRWTAPQLAFAARAARRRDPGAWPLQVAGSVPDVARPGRRGPAAIVVHARGPLPERIQRVLDRGGVASERSRWGDFAIFSGIDAAEVHRGLGLPGAFGRREWPPLPDPPDGFN